MAYECCGKKFKNERMLASHKKGNPHLRESKYWEDLTIKPTREGYFWCATCADSFPLPMLKHYGSATHARSSAKRNMVRVARGLEPFEGYGWVLKGGKAVPPSGNLLDNIIKHGDPDPAPVVVIKKPRKPRVRAVPSGPPAIPPRPTRKVVAPPLPPRPSAEVIKAIKTVLATPGITVTKEKSFKAGKKVKWVPFVC